jgi:hypothetical protein
MDYLDIVWDTYWATYGEAMPVDVWTMHVYVLSEQDEGDADVAVGADTSLRIPFASDGNCADPNTICHAEHDDMDLFRNQVVLMRQWMKDHGQQSKPLLLTEFGILKPFHYPWPGHPDSDGICSVVTCPSPSTEPDCFCDESNRTFNPARVGDFLLSTLDYLLNESDADLGLPADENRLVQQVLWYRLATENVDGLGHASNIADPDTMAGDEWALTSVGQEWQDYAQAIPPTVSLLARPVPTTTGYFLPEGSAAVELVANVINNGNVAASDAVTVTFYTSEEPRQVLGSTVVEGIPGCARREVSASLLTAWPGAAIGPNEYVFEIGLDGGVADTGEGIVEVFGHVTFLPVALRSS